MTKAPTNFQMPGNCICANLRRAARLATRLYDDALSATGLTSPQFSALALLAAKGAMTTRAFANAMAMDRTTSTRNLSLLEADGWVERRAGDDRRERVISITGAGRRKLKAALPRWKAAQDAMIRDIGAATARRIITDAARLETALESGRTG